MSVGISFTVPPNTPDSQPVEAVIPISAPILRDIDAYFPEGCKNVVGIRFKDYGSQFWPETGWLYGANRSLSWNGRKRLTGPGYWLVVQGYSRASDWPHTIEINVTVNMGVD
jgi:hypothetical protein